jgi:hypothetical protein
MSIATAQELKGLQSQLAGIDGEIRSLKDQQSSIGRQIVERSTRLSSLRQRIERLLTSSAGVVITEHALLRFLERVDLIDMDIVRKRIMPEATLRQIQELGNGKYPVADSHVVVVKNNSIVSILEATR